MASFNSCSLLQLTLVLILKASLNLPVHVGKNCHLFEGQAIMQLQHFREQPGKFQKGLLCPSFTIKIVFCRWPALYGLEPFNNYNTHYRSARLQLYNQFLSCLNNLYTWQFPAGCNRATDLYKNYSPYWSILETSCEYFNTILTALKLQFNISSI